MAAQRLAEELARRCEELNVRVCLEGALAEAVDEGDPVEPDRFEPPADGRDRRDDLLDPVEDRLKTDLLQRVERPLDRVEYPGKPRRRRGDVEVTGRVVDLRGRVVLGVDALDREDARPGERLAPDPDPEPLLDLLPGPLFGKSSPNPVVTKRERGDTTASGCQVVAWKSVGRVMEPGEARALRTTARRYSAGSSWSALAVSKIV